MFERHPVEGKSIGRKMPKPTEWERAQGMTRGTGAKKQLPVCHLCGREFGTASIKIHMKACAEKYEREKGKPAPPPPEMLDQLTSGDGRKISQMDWDAYNSQANAAAEAQMEACPMCGRTFAAKDRLALHMRSCTGEKKILRAGEKSQRSGTSPPTARSGAAASAAKPSLLKRMSSASLLRKSGKEEAGEEAAPPKPSLLERMSSASLLRSSKPSPPPPPPPNEGGGGGTARKGAKVKKAMAIEPASQLISDCSISTRDPHTSHTLSLASPASAHFASPGPASTLLRSASVSSRSCSTAASSRKLSSMSSAR